MKKKGFTLIELLAVIVILAVIALIAVPIILGVVDDARKSASVSSAYGYVRAVEKEFMMSSMKDEYFEVDEELNVSESPLKDIKVQGNKPSKGFLSLNENGTVAEGTFCIEKYKVVYDGNVAKTEKGGCDTIVIVPSEKKIIDIVKEVVYDNDKCKADGTTYNFMGGCYIKGNTTNNYLWYSGYIWRIMGINADGTVRLITEKGVTNIPFSAVDANLQYDNSYAKEWLNNYFFNSLKGNDIIKDQTWCSEQSHISAGGGLSPQCVKNLSTNKAKVGIVTMNEYTLVGAKNSYIINNEHFISLTPSDKSNSWIILNDGNKMVNYSYGSHGLRPVINVDGDALVTAGNGALNENTWTKTNAPYILNEKKIKINITNQKISNMATTGEYVKLDNKTYRVVSKDSVGVKLILDDFYTEPSTFGSNSTFSTTSGIGQLLDTKVYNWLFSNQIAKDKVVTSTWYQGNYSATDLNYKTTSLSETNPKENVKVGLIKMGEIKQMTNKIPTSQYFWSLTAINASQLYAFWWINSPQAYYGTTAIDIRPVIIVKNDLNISGGNGTPSNPYQI